MTVIYYSSSDSSLRDIPGRRGELEKARQVFEYVPLQQRNVWHVTALCSAYANAGAERMGAVLWALTAPGHWARLACTAQGQHTASRPSSCMHFRCMVAAAHFHACTQQMTVIPLSLVLNWAHAHRFSPLPSLIR